MVKALKALQEKIRGLELDRVMAVKHFSDETERHEKTFQNAGRSPSPSASLRSASRRQSCG